jgi:hypothetical protein
VEHFIWFMFLRAAEFSKGDPPRCIDSAREALIRGSGRRSEPTSGEEILPPMSISPIPVRLPYEVDNFQI